NPDQADDGRIHIEVIGEACAHTSNFLVGARPHEFLLCAGRGRETRRAGLRLFRAAAVAKLGTDGDVFMAVRASHLRTPKIRVLLALPAIGYAKKGEKVSRASSHQTDGLILKKLFCGGCDVAGLGGDYAFTFLRV